MEAIKGFISALGSQMCWPKYAQPVIYQFRLSSFLQVIDKRTAVPTSSFMSGVSAANVWSKHRSVFNAHELAAASSLSFSQAAGLIYSPQQSGPWLHDSGLSNLLDPEFSEYLQKTAKKVARETVTTSQTSSRLSSPIHYVCGIAGGALAFILSSFPLTSSTACFLIISLILLTER